MKYWGIVDNVAYLPPTRELLCVTALRVRLQTGRLESLLFRDEARAATVRAGEWVRFDADLANAPSVRDHRGFNLELMPVIAVTAPVEGPFPAEAERVAALQRFIEARPAASHLFADVARERPQPNEVELQEIDQRLQALRKGFDTVQLPLALVLEAIPEKYRSPVWLEAAGLASPEHVLRAAPSGLRAALTKPRESTALPGF